MKSVFRFSKCIDLHSHLYYPKYMEILRNRCEIPLVTQDNRLVILPNETSIGRPIGEEYTAIDVKLKFMQIHGYNIKSILIMFFYITLDFISEFFTLFNVFYHF